jgi:para-nitrobenzyl esterase
MIVAETGHGKLRGAEIADGVLAWRGIPYAAPPVGKLRLRLRLRPEPPALERPAGRARRAWWTPGGAA